MHKTIFTQDNLHILFVLNLVGEGEWLSEVEERAGESRRALWGVKSSQEQVLSRTRVLPLDQTACLLVPTGPSSVDRDPVD